MRASDFLADTAFRAPSGLRSRGIASPTLFEQLAREGAQQEFCWKGICFKRLGFGCGSRISLMSLTGAPRPRPHTSFHRNHRAEVVIEKLAVLGLAMMILAVPSAVERGPRYSEPPSMVKVPAAIRLG